MKNIEIDDELYQYIVTQTQFIGEDASSILRRLISFSDSEVLTSITDVSQTPQQVISQNPETSINEKKQVKSEAVDALSINDEIMQVANKSAEKESVFNFINKEELAMQRGAVGRFLLILGALYRAHSNDFYVVNDICGRDRLYFASSKQALEESGSSTKPRQIGESSFWVITNSNTTRKKMILTKVAIFLGYQEADVEKIRELL